MAETLPFSGYCKITGQLLVAIADQIFDIDKFPDGVPAVGYATLTPSVTGKLLRFVAADKTVVAKNILVTLDSTGKPSINGSTDVYVPPTDDPAGNPADWTYMVDFFVYGPDGVGLDIPSYSLQCPTDGEVDLFNASPVSSSGGTLTIQGPAGPPGITPAEIAAIEDSIEDEEQARIAADLNKVDYTPAGRDKLAAQDFTKIKPLEEALYNRNTAKVDIGVMGPSTVAGYGTNWVSTIPQALARRLRQRFPIDGNSPSQGGTGAIPVPDSAIRGVSAAPSLASTPWSFSAGMQFDETGFASGLNHTIAYTNGVETGQLTTDRDLTHFKVSHVSGTSGGAAGAFIQANALTAVTFSTTSGSTAVAENTFTAAQLGFPGGVIPAGTVIKVGGTNSGYFILSHGEGFYNDATKGIHVHNIGHSGYDTLAWEQTVAGGTTRATIAALSLDFLLLPFYGINAGSTGGSNRTAAQWKTDMIAHIAWLRAGGITCNILLVAAYDTTPALTLASPWSAYVQAHREIATADNTVAFLDLGLRMPNTSAVQTYGMYQVDKVHMFDKGNYHVVDEILDYLLGSIEGGPLGDSLPRKMNLVNGRSLRAEMAPALAIPDWTTGKWYEGQYKGVTASTSGLTRGTIFYDLVFVPNAITLSALACRLGSAVASNVSHLGIYASDAGGTIPTTKLASAAVAAAAAGLVQTPALNTVLPAGFYWTAFMNIGGSSDPTVGISSGGAAVPGLGSATAIPTNVTAAIPAAHEQTGLTGLPATATPALITNTQTTRPRVALLVA